MSAAMDQQQCEAPKVLVVDDEAAMREVLLTRLEASGYRVTLAQSGEEARRLAQSEEPDLVISDVVLPDDSGLRLLKSLAGEQRRPVILITGYGNIDEAVEAMKQGAYDFLTKPLDYEKLHATMARAHRDSKRSQRAQRLSSRADGRGGLMVGESPAMQKVYEMIGRVARCDATTLIVGESGTGKELVARAIHDSSARSQGPLVALNSAAIPEGLTESELFGHERGAFTGAVSSRPGCFESADGGTLFLDEIGEMAITLQPKLLRILESGDVRRLGGSRSRPFDVRVLAATNRDPFEAMSQGLLREDLYYRLGVFVIEVPPLRERRSDIPLLCQRFVETLNQRHGSEVEGLDDEVYEHLDRYPWPGNVRELRNAVERAVILASRGFIKLRHLPPQLTDLSASSGRPIVLPAGVTAAEAERIVVVETLERLDQNKAEAARQLGLDVKTVRNRLKAHARNR